MEEFYPVRYSLYAKRKEHMLDLMNRDLSLMQNKCRFINGVNDGSVRLREQTKSQIEAQLSLLNFASSKQLKQSSNSEKFDYLLSMPLYSLTKEKVDDLKSKIEAKKIDIQELARKTVEDLWLSDLDLFESQYIKDLKRRGFEYQITSSQKEFTPFTSK